MILRIRRLSLSHFRNYETLRLESLEKSIIVLSGPNGSGKTNLLEAISLLTPGSGLRQAALADIQVRGNTLPWAVSAEIETSQNGLIRIGTGLRRDPVHPERFRRVLRLDGRDVKNQAEIGMVFSCLWLTPQMDRLFIEGASHRRRFLDRLVFSYDPEHAHRMTRLEKNMRERLALLTPHHIRAPCPDPVWLDTLERQMAEDCVLIAQSRAKLLHHLSIQLENLQRQQILFPIPAFELKGVIEDIVKEKSDQQGIEFIRRGFAEKRASDALAGRTQIGTHRSAWIAYDKVRNMPADQCSTGEQKAFLIAIVLAHAFLMKQERKHAPVLLLDEIVAHLDTERRQQLFDLLNISGAQVWMTGTDGDVFKSLREQARFLYIESGRCA